MLNATFVLKLFGILCTFHTASLMLFPLNLAFRDKLQLRRFWIIIGTYICFQGCFMIRCLSMGTALALFVFDTMIYSILADIQLPSVGAIWSVWLALLKLRLFVVIVAITASAFVATASKYTQNKRSTARKSSTTDPQSNPSVQSSATSTPRSSPVNVPSINAPSPTTAQEPPVVTTTLEICADTNASLPVTSITIEPNTRINWVPQTSLVPFGEELNDETDVRNAVIEAWKRDQKRDADLEARMRRLKNMEEKAPQKADSPSAKIAAKTNTKQSAVQTSAKPEGKSRRKSDSRLRGVLCKTHEKPPKRKSLTGQTRPKENKLTPKVSSGTSAAATTTCEKNEKLFSNTPANNHPVHNVTVSATNNIANLCDTLTKTSSETISVDLKEENVFIKAIPFGKRKP